MDAHIKAVCRSAFFQLKQISQIRNALDMKTAQMFVHALVTSCMDYCNALLYGLPQTLISKLQRVQNQAARIVTGAHGSDHITPVRITSATLVASGEQNPLQNHDAHLPSTERSGSSIHTRPAESV
eukprot:GHVR01049592.1.p1 GENE.GHVR01049592.1~~GHVR01049592.1.p1  ORF type:complete len:126 (-),score=0.05 GHVR01049592.1:212-589(-)